jgi:hypothetical protein
MSFSDVSFSPGLGLDVDAFLSERDWTLPEILGYTHLPK